MLSRAELEKSFITLGPVLWATKFLPQGQNTVVAAFNKILVYRLLERKKIIFSNVHLFSKPYLHSDTQHYKNMHFISYEIILHHDIHNNFFRRFIYFKINKLALYEFQNTLI